MCVPVPTVRRVRSTAATVATVAVVVALVFSTGLAGAATAAPAGGAASLQTAGATSTTGLFSVAPNETDTTLTDDSTTSGDDTTDTNTTDTLTSTSDDNTTDTTDSNTTDSTTSSVTDSTDSTVDNTTDSTTATTTETVETTENATSETVSDTVETAQNVTETTQTTANATLANATESVETTVEQTTETVGDTLARTTDGELTVGATASVETALDSTERRQSGTGSQRSADSARDREDAFDTEMPPNLAKTGDVSVDTESTVEQQRPIPTRQPPTGQWTGVAVAGLVTSAVLSGTSAFGTSLGGSGGLTGSSLRGASRALRRRARVAARRLPLLPGYSRYDDSDPLEHDTRQSIYDAITADPGINLSLLADTTGTSMSTARHHLKVLQDERLVDTRKQDGRRRYYPVGTDDEALQAALQHPMRAAILRVLAQRAPLSNGDLADELDRDPSTTTHHLQRLEDAGLVERTREGRSVVTELSSDAAEVLHSPTDSAAIADD